MNFRQLNILNFLLDQDNYVTAKALSERFNVTPKTIYLDTNILKEELKTYELSINKKTNRGIILTGLNENKKIAKLELNSKNEGSTEQ